MKKSKILTLQDIWDKRAKKLFVRVAEGVGLAPKDSNGLSDPYVKLIYGKQQHKTAVYKKTLNPKFGKNEIFFFEVDGTTELHIEVWDHDKIKSDDFMGQVKLGTIETFLSGSQDRENVVSKWLTLEPRPGKKHDHVSGKLLCHFYFSAEKETRPVEEEYHRYAYYYSQFKKQFQSGDVILYDSYGTLPSLYKMFSEAPYSNIAVVLKLPNKWTHKEELYLLEISRNIDRFLDAYKEVPAYGVCIFRMFERLHFVHSQNIWWCSLKTRLTDAQHDALLDWFGNAHKHSDLYLDKMAASAVDATLINSVVQDVIEKLGGSGGKKLQLDTREYYAVDLLAAALKGIDLCLTKDINKDNVLLPPPGTLKVVDIVTKSDIYNKPVLLRTLERLAPASPPIPQPTPVAAVPTPATTVAPAPLVSRNSNIAGGGASAATGSQRAIQRLKSFAITSGAPRFTAEGEQGDNEEDQSPPSTTSASSLQRPPPYSPAAVASSNAGLAPPPPYFPAGTPPPPQQQPPPPQYQPQGGAPPPPYPSYTQSAVGSRSSEYMSFPPAHLQSQQPQQQQPILQQPPYAQQQQQLQHPTHVQFPPRYSPEPIRQPVGVQSSAGASTPLPSAPASSIPMGNVINEFQAKKGIPLPSSPATTTAPTPTAPPPKLDQVKKAGGPRNRRPPTKLKERIDDSNLQKLMQFDEAGLESLFRTISSTSLTSGTEALDKAAFQQLMVSHGFTLYQHPELLNSFFAALDADESGFIDKHELCCGLLILAGTNIQKKLKLCFSIFDTNEDGYIQRQELEAALTVVAAMNSNMNLAEQAEWIHRMSGDIFARFDTNQDNQLSFDEFLLAADSNPQLQSILTLEGAVIRRNL